MAARPAKEIVLDSYSAKISENMRKMREAAGLSVEQVIERMADAGYSVKRATYYHWESTHSKPDLDALPYWAKAVRLKVKDQAKLFPPLSIA